MATLNSERTIEKALAAIRAQDYPQDQVEILVVDGGSTDRTREIAKKFSCRILDNPKVEPVAAKIIGIREATGDYLVYHDSDEVMEDTGALQKRAAALFENPDVFAVFAEGYRTPTGLSFVNAYINEFGDPFSMFYYRLSKDYRFFPHDILKFCLRKKETNLYRVYETRPDRPQPIMETAAQASAIDLAFFRKNFSDLLDKPWGLVHFFYHMQTHTRKFAVTRNDPVAHYSADHWSGYLRKIRSRVLNNIFQKESLAAAGFTGRAQFEPVLRRAKRFAFLPYALLGFPLFVDCIRYMITRRDWRYIAVFPLTLYTAFSICWYLLLKWTGYRPVQKGYGV
ncbi:MAG: glycosyltransferase [Bdellovibrionales bacterium]